MSEWISGNFAKSAILGLPTIPSFMFTITNGCLYISNHGVVLDPNCFNTYKQYYDVLSKAHFVNFCFVHKLKNGISVLPALADFVKMVFVCAVLHTKFSVIDFIPEMVLIFLRVLAISTVLQACSKRAKKQFSVFR